MIPALILAAGAGRRMGGPKARLVLDGETLLQRTVRVALAAGCHPVIAVVGEWDVGPVDTRVTVIRNREAAEGMASSIRAGITALPSAADATLLLAVDQPNLDAALLEKLLALAAQDPSRPAACAYGGSLGIPAVLPRSLFRDLLLLRGEHGAKAILQRKNAATLAFPGGEADLDTPEDLDRISRLGRSAGAFGDGE
jgi:molybdenum cofactor cytidylyltransferase